MKHTPVAIPRIQDPFAGQDDRRAIFWERLAYAASADILPSGYGHHRGEEGYGQWANSEKVTVGKRRRGHEMKVTLSKGIWEPRVKAWIMAVDGLSQMRLS